MGVVAIERPLALVADGAEHADSARADEAQLRVQEIPRHELEPAAGKILDLALGIQGGEPDEAGVVMRNPKRERGAGHEIGRRAELQLVAGEALLAGVDEGGKMVGAERCHDEVVERHAEHRGIERELAQKPARLDTALDRMRALGGEDLRALRFGEVGRRRLERALPGQVRVDRLHRVRLGPDQADERRDVPRPRAVGPLVVASGELVRRELAGPGVQLLRRAIPAAAARDRDRRRRRPLIVRVHAQERAPVVERADITRRDLAHVRDARRIVDVLIEVEPGAAGGRPAPGHGGARHRLVAAGERELPDQAPVLEHGGLLGPERHALGRNVAARVQRIRLREAAHRVLEVARHPERVLHAPP